jgi:hypothetical protein
MEGEAKVPRGAKCKEELKEANNVDHPIAAAPAQKVPDRLMATVTLLLGDAAFPVGSLGLRQICDLFATGSVPSPSHVQSKAPLGFFRLFLEAVSGKDIPITNENVSDLSQLCEEFSFWNLSAKVSALCESL